MSGKIDDAIRRDAAIRKAIEENNVEFSKQISVALGQLAYQVKADVMHLSERIALLEKSMGIVAQEVVQLKERFTMVNGHQAGREPT